MASPTIVFDTDCVLCSGAVVFILRHERDAALTFVGAWSSEGERLAAAHGFTRADLDETLLVITEGRALTRSEAGLAVAAHLRRPWRWLGLLRVVPRPIRDGIYSAIARRRYRWFGKSEDCAVAPPEQRHRFIGVKIGA